MKIGVISDTHNYLDPKVHTLFKGVDHILHAGDIGLTTIISELETIAPVTAVLGNNDPGLPYRETEVVELAGRTFLIYHIITPRSLATVPAERIAAARPDVVVFGHTHQRFNEVIEGCLYFNPGYAGKPRFTLERSVAILNCTAKKLSVKFLPL